MNKGAFCLILLLAIGLMSCQGKIHKPWAQTLQGCVAEANGGYVLTTDSGDRYMLVGDADQLRPQAGHEVLVRGLLVQSAKEPQAPAEADSRIQNQLDVNSVQFVSNGCAGSH